ncbi:glycosyltransferase, partial [Candidatus Cloacimonadota bacterium]
MIFFFVIFCLFLLVLGIGNYRNWLVNEPKINSYSIIIACRNEEHNLPELFRALDKIDYPHDKYEILIADDASTDRSPELLKQYSQNNPIVSVIYLTTKDSEYKGKKAALKAATDLAKNDILLFTDADCLPDKNWLSSYNKYFDEKIAMVIGFSPEVTDNKFLHFTQFLNAGLYSSTTGLGIPFSCTGRNFALKKEVFFQIGGYDSFRTAVAGDDKLLLNRVFNQKYKIVYNAESPVYTKKSDDYIEQQKRRYSKFFQQRSFIKLLSIFILLFYVFLPFQVL